VFAVSCCWREKNVEYPPFGALPDWASGFLELHIGRNAGEFHVIPHFIINGATVSNGQVISA
jgi:hypothetical protein